MQFGSVMAATTETEGVGFEPTVGFPTLDFESSALNRTQPPFQSLILSILFQDAQFSDGHCVYKGKA
jgi:hypothetical protein